MDIYVNKKRYFYYILNGVNYGPLHQPKRENINF